MPDTSPSYPRRVLFLARHLGLGGATTHMRTLAGGLREHGVEVRIASRPVETSEALGPAWFADRGIAHIPVPFPTPRAPARLLPDAVRSWRALAAAVRAFRPELVHVHWRSTSLYALLLRMAYDLPFVTTLHSQQIPSSFRHRLLSFWGAGVICVSRDAEAFLRRTFPRLPARIVTIPHGVDAHYFRPPNRTERLQARAKLGLPADGPLLTMLGRLNPEKGIDLFIDALARLRVQGVCPPALVAGEGNPAPYRTLAQRHGVADQIRFRGFTDARTALWASDVLVLPSRREGLPMTVVEALHCGVVPVRTPAGGSQEQIQDGVNGYIVPFEDVDALADRLARLLRDDPRRARMAQAARHHALHYFTADVMTRQTLAVYRDVLHAAAEHPTASASR